MPIYKTCGKNTTTTAYLTCTHDAAILKVFIEKDKVYDFLADLNSEFDWVQVQILSKEEFEEVVSSVRAEES